MLMASFYTHPTCEVSLDSTLKQPLRYILLGAFKGSQLYSS